CEEGTYKPFAGDSDCNGCPNNSYSASPGAVSCQCLSGYYRAPHEDITVRCTAPPSSPQNLTNTSVTKTNISIAWLEPTYNGGRTDLYYVISIKSSTNVIEYSTGHTNYTLMGLTPFTTYEIQVIARNGVSDQDNANDNNRTVTITVTTLNSMTNLPSTETPQLLSLTLMIGAPVVLVLVLCVCIIIVFVIVIIVRRNRKKRLVNLDLSFVG
uniref:Fibronectin type-III domain-containing protein n=1 Tax=Amphimedon queenslandica TaxID=400682 RepID=A0A1X7SI22_AMPQE